ncbi:AcrR family transcriptional regulator [Actinoplanes lutulentus]|uniref:TetR family transcriptional regulator n=1 Tax=Actinoplanes lutulentus TaxID=1287878 RepID=A0A327Z3U2_9ACTN|nr:TetR/AcrR family transcriptional regulator [Actinoplanes lutulentus]MBB2947793.1 AcrR family transcriptional regulator [Actinoplanes lutulentus]RAK29893.1 TetR family transcriptional regulator [Actinoplanes lutulentus]
MTQATSTRRRSGPSKGDLREAAILDAARRLFGEQPYESVSIDDLARAAGLSRTGFYFYFRTKGAVLTALMSRYWETLGASHVWFDSDGPSRELLREQLRSSAYLWREHAGVMKCAPTAVATSSELRDFMTRVKSRQDERASDKISRDQRDGTATTSIAAPRLAEMISAIRDARYTQLANASDADLEAAVEDIAEAIQRLVYGG